MPTYLSPGVYVEEVESGSRPIEGVGTAVAAFVGLAEKGPVDEPTLVTSWAQFTKNFGEFVEGYYLAHAVYGYFQNGGGACYIVRVGGNGNGSSPQAAAELGTGAQALLGGFRVRALDPGVAGNAISIEVADAGEGAPEDQFKLIVRRDGNVAEEYDKVTARKGKQNVVTVVNAQSKLIKLEEVTPGGALDRPVKGSATLVGGGAPSAPAAPPAPARLTPDDYVGDPADRTGFGGLEAIDPVTMVCVPDLMAAYQKGMLDLEGVQAVQLAVIAHSLIRRFPHPSLPPAPSRSVVPRWSGTQPGPSTSSSQELLLGYRLRQRPRSPSHQDRRGVPRLDEHSWRARVRNRSCTSSHRRMPH